MACRKNWHVPCAMEPTTGLVIWEAEHCVACPVCAEVLERRARKKAREAEEKALKLGRFDVVDQKHAADLRRGRRQPRASSERRCAARQGGGGAAPRPPRARAVGVVVHRARRD